MLRCRVSSQSGLHEGIQAGQLHSTLWWRAASYLSTYESFRPVCYLSPCTSSGKSRTLADVSSGVYRSGSVGDVSSGVYRSGSLNSATVVLGINPRHWVVKNPAWLHTPGTYPQDIPWIHKGFPGRSIPLSSRSIALSSQPPPWLSQANPDLVIGVTLCHYYCVQVSSYYYFSSFAFASCIGDYFVPHLLLQELLFGLCPGQRQLRSLDYLFGRFAILLLGERGSLSFISEGYPISFLRSSLAARIPP